ncbi:MAG: secondary thiamine-phosphate synthase enzyme YjbQ [Candidatus Omnitrophota bacterium]
MSSKNVSTLRVSSARKVQFIDITSDISDFVRKSGVADGICFIHVPHTTAGVTINENADPDVVADMITALEHIVPSHRGYLHAEGNSPAHVKSSLIGCSEKIFVSAGKLLLGTWQGIYFCEFDGPRSRKAHLKIVEGRNMSSRTRRRRDPGTNKIIM